MQTRLANAVRRTRGAATTQTRRTGAMALAAAPVERTPAEDDSEAAAPPPGDRAADGVGAARSSLDSEESDSEDEDDGSLVVARFGDHVLRRGPLSPRGSYKQRYKARLLDPRVGDAVEVAWRGKFRLESLEIYRGTAWWVAIVVDKVQLDGTSSATSAPPNPATTAGDLRRVHASHSWYKVTFPGWEGRWDEWVSRDRLRWAAPVDRDERKILLHDNVEVWCGSKNVPGAWLEATVQRVKDQEFFMIGRVLSTGSLWVERSRIRLARRNSPPPPVADHNCAKFAFKLLLRNSPFRLATSSWRRLSNAFRRSSSTRDARTVARSVTVEAP